MGDRTSLDTFQPVEHEVQLAVPYWSLVGMLVNQRDQTPELGNREVRRVVLDVDATELTAAHVAARVERFRAKGVAFLVIPADVYPWLERHPDLKRYLRTQFARVDADAKACRIYALQRREEPDPPRGDDGLPLPPPEMVALVGGNLARDEFFRVGRYAVTWIAEMVARNGVEPAGLGAILDFGCGCGRVIRHWPAVTDAQLYGSDYNPYLVRWCADNLPFGDFRTNQLEPPLPFEDDTFDLVYSLSIFTHLDSDLQVPWIEELTRVTKPGGLVLPTFHGRAKVEFMRPTPHFPEISPGFEAGELIVLEAGQSGSSACAAYHPESYVRDVLGKNLELLDFSPNGALDIQQDAVLFRKPAS